MTTKWNEIEEAFGKGLPGWELSAGAADDGTPYGTLAAIHGGNSITVTPSPKGDHVAALDGCGSLLARAATFSDLRTAVFGRSL